ncbi:uncharacterized protein LOC142236538 [Haematobia irritans]|uniref:uncharacterized protein LOC142236538 n=1 Tax=Haematobia irritans TaxID=7368 RepID=UPI003F500A40
MMVVATGAPSNIGGVQQQQHHHQQQQTQQHQQQQQQHQEHTRQIITSTLAQHQQQLQNNNTTIIATHAPNGGVSATAAATTTTIAAAAPSNLEAFSNIATAAQTLELSSLNAAQLVGGHLTANGDFVTMGGVVVGRLHPAPGNSGAFLQHQLRIQTPHLGVIKMEPSPHATEFQSTDNNNYNNANNTTRHSNTANEG